MPVSPFLESVARQPPYESPPLIPLAATNSTIVPPCQQTPFSECVARAATSVSLRVMAFLEFMALSNGGHCTPLNGLICTTAYPQLHHHCTALSFTYISCTVSPLYFNLSPHHTTPLEIMSSPESSTSQPKPNELTKWRDSTNVILDYYEDFLRYSSITDHVQLSSQVVFHS